MLAQGSCNQHAEKVQDSKPEVLPADVTRAATVVSGDAEAASPPLKWMLSVSYREVLKFVTACSMSRLLLRQDSSAIRSNCMAGEQPLHPQTVFGSRRGHLGAAVVDGCSVICPRSLLLTVGTSVTEWCRMKWARRYNASQRQESAGKVGAGQPDDQKLDFGNLVGYLSNVPKYM